MPKIGVDPKAARVPPAERAAEAKENEAARAIIQAMEVAELAAGGDASARLYLQRKDSQGEWAHVPGAMSPAEFDVDRIAEMHGGGIYRYQIRGRKEDGSKGIIATQQFRILGPPKEVGGPLPAAPVPPVVAATDRMLEMMVKRGDDLQALLLAVLTRQQPAAGGLTLQDALALAQNLKGGGVSLEQYLKDVRDAEERGYQRGQDVDAPPPDPFTETVRQLAGPIAQALQRQTGAAGPGGDSVARLTQPRQPAPPDVPAPPWLPKFLEFGKLVMAMAEANAAPAYVVDLVLDRTPESFQDQLAGDMVAPTWVDDTLKLAPLAPLVRRFPEWTRAVLTELQVALTEEEEADAGDISPENAPETEAS